MRLWIKSPLACLGHPGSAGIVVDGARIAEVLATGGKPGAPVDEIFDARRHVLLPGLVNTHHHFYQTLTRAHPAAINKPLFPWLETLYPRWARLTPADVGISTRLALVELMLSGCTTASDHHYLFPANCDEAIDIQIAEARALGMRFCATRGSMDISYEEGGLPPRSVVQDRDTILADCERLIAKVHDAGEGAMIQIALAPCSPFSVSRELFTQTAALARRHGCRLHTHLAETHDEETFCQEKFGCRPVDYLAESGWLGPDAWFAHGIHFSAVEIARLGACGTAISHCPTSNMVLASGCCRTLDLETSGVGVGLGVDGSASNDSSNMMEAVRHALMINRLTYGAERITHFDVLRWATEGSARCLGRDDIGRIAPGKMADLALFTLDEMRFSGAGDPLAALVLCGAHRADRVMINGHWRVIDASPVGLDPDRLIAAHSAAARKFLERL
jgi:8-oxoguanine deaminase